jgi:hypothetical protein
MSASMARTRAGFGRPNRLGEAIGIAVLGRGSQHPDADQEIVATSDEPETDADEHQADDHRGRTPPAAWGRDPGLLENGSPVTAPPADQLAGRLAKRQQIKDGRDAVSASECEASAASADEPVITAAPALASATPRPAARATTTVRMLSPAGFGPGPQIRRDHDSDGAACSRSPRCSSTSHRAEVRR